MALLGLGGMHDQHGFCIYCNQQKARRHIIFQFKVNTDPVNFSAQARDNQIPAGALFVMNGGKDLESSDRAILEAQFAHKTVPLDGSMQYLDSLVAEGNCLDGAESDEDCVVGPEEGSASIPDKGMPVPKIKKRKLAHDKGLDEQGVSRNVQYLSLADAIVIL
jgi:hypothetical protein